MLINISWQWFWNLWCIVTLASFCSYILVLTPDILRSDIFSRQILSMLSNLLQFCRCCQIYNNFAINRFGVLIGTHFIPWIICNLFSGLLLMWVSAPCFSPKADKTHFWCQLCVLSCQFGRLQFMCCGSNHHYNMQYFMNYCA